MPDSSTKKTTMMSDYIPKLMELYPTISKKDLLRMIKSFQLSFLNLVKKDASIMIRQYSRNDNVNKFTMIFNNLNTYDSLKAYQRWQRQISKKIRIKYKMLNRQWDGYYYFALSDRFFARILAQKKRSRKYYIFEHIMLYKVFEECLANSRGKKHVFRVPYAVDFGWKCYKPVYECSDFEYIYRNNEDKLEQVNIDNRCDNNLFSRKTDFLWLKWVDKDLIKSKNKK